VVKRCANPLNHTAFAKLFVPGQCFGNEAYDEQCRNGAKASSRDEEAAVAERVDEPASSRSGQV
jgi:hypothetical protein